MASPTATGNLLAGRYRVIERLGSGGMAVVYLAEDERLGRRVAVKRLHTGSPEDTAQRFSREARLGASLNHPNIATVYDTVTDDSSVVIVMEYVEGARITHSGSVMGTAAYMAPEQLDGSQAGPATDVYALAAVAYEMLTGQPAYRGSTPVEIAHQVVNGPPPELAEAWPQAPRGACDSVRGGLSFH